MVRNYPTFGRSRGGAEEKALLEDSSAATGHGTQASESLMPRRHDGEIKVVDRSITFR
jgi:hypothetical protein